jgi:hypothetical protein
MFAEQVINCCIVVLSGNIVLPVIDAAGDTTATAKKCTRISRRIIRRIDGAEAQFISDAEGIDDQFPRILEGGICVTCTFWQAIQAPQLCETHGCVIGHIVDLAVDPSGGNSAQQCLRDIGMMHHMQPFCWMPLAKDRQGIVHMRISFPIDKTQT